MVFLCQIASMIEKKVEGTYVVTGDGSDMDQRNYEVINHVGVGTVNIADIRFHNLCSPLL